jgi:phosphopentomutase
MFRVFQEGFPEEVIKRFVEKTGIPGVLGNVPASGTEIIKELGEEHIKTGKPIVYTSADSVFQIACHEEVYSPEKLYELCKVARDILVGENEVARVIARPFTGKEGAFERTSNRRDFAILPSEENILSYIKKSNREVMAVGKIEDIFCGVGITHAVHTKDNMDGINQTINYMKTSKQGLIFTNLVEFDSKWGHRNDYKGYAKGLEEFDKGLGFVMDMMNDEDVLIITADHGCDPTVSGTDHTREYVPLLLYGKTVKKGINLGTRDSFADIAATLAEIFKLKKTAIGESFWKEVRSDMP